MFFPPISLNCSMAFFSKLKECLLKTFPTRWSISCSFSVHLNFMNKQLYLEVFGVTTLYSVFSVICSCIKQNLNPCQPLSTLGRIGSISRKSFCGSTLYILLCFSFFLLLWKTLFFLKGSYNKVNNFFSDLLNNCFFVILLLPKTRLSVDSHLAFLLPG